MVVVVLELFFFNLFFLIERYFFFNVCILFLGKNFDGFCLGYGFNYGLIIVFREIEYYDCLGFEL